MKTTSQYPQQVMPQRNLKIYSKFRSRKYDMTKIPAIRLEGKWLDKLGFKEGKQVTIEISSNKLIIHLLEETNNNSI